MIFFRTIISIKLKISDKQNILYDSYRLKFLSNRCLFIKINATNNECNKNTITKQHCIYKRAHNCR